MATDTTMRNANTGEGRPRLLIADDEGPVRSMLTAQLQYEFEIVGAVADGEAAVDFARRLHPDAVLLDVQMPAGGPQAAKMIGAVSPETAIVVLSIDESRSSVIEYLHAGAMTYLRKGTPPAMLADRLHQAISAHRHELAAEAGDP